MLASSGLNATYLLVGIVSGCSGALATMAAGYRWVWPALKAAKKKRKEESLFMDGANAIPGVADEIKPARVRLKNVESGMRRVEGKVDTVSLEVRGLRAMIVALSNQLTSASQANLDATKSVETKVTPNGGDTNNLGDVVRRLAEKDGTWIAEEDETDESTSPAAEPPVSD